MVDGIAKFTVTRRGEVVFGTWQQAQISVRQPAARPRDAWQPESSQPHHDGALQASSKAPLKWCLSKGLKEAKQSIDDNNRKHRSHEGLLCVHVLTTRCC